jgi:hypothetical protein
MTNIYGVADWRYEFVRGGSDATHKFILGLSNAIFMMTNIYKVTKIFKDDQKLIASAKIAL